MLPLDVSGEDPPAVTQPRSFTKPSVQENAMLWNQFVAVPITSKANVVAYLEERKHLWVYGEGCGWEECQLTEKRKSVLAAVVNRFELGAASNKSSYALCAHCFSVLACNSTYLKEHLVVQCCAPDELKFVFAKSVSATAGRKLAGKADELRRLYAAAPGARCQRHCLRVLLRARVPLVRGPRQGCQNAHDAGG